jgi:mono/diheme cytochrome c family protein
MSSKTGIAFILCIAATACSKPEPAAAPAAAPQELAKPAEPAAPAPAAPTASADTPESVFKTRCVMCHGESGKGDGAAAAALNPKPRDYTDAEWQKSVTDDQIKKAITGGGAAVGKSAIMPAQPDLAAKPEVLDGLVKIIRSFAKS